MSQYNAGDVLYIVHSGDRALLNNQVRVMEMSDGPAVKVAAIGFTFPHGETVASIQGAYLSSAPTRNN